MSTGGWSSQDCSRNAQFICKVPPIKEPPPPAPKLLCESGWTYFHMSNACFKVRKSQIPEAICNKLWFYFTLSECTLLDCKGISKLLRSRSSLCRRKRASDFNSQFGGERYSHRYISTATLTERSIFCPQIGPRSATQSTAGRKKCGSVCRAWKARPSTSGSMDRP